MHKINENFKGFPVLTFDGIGKRPRDTGELPFEIIFFFFFVIIVANPSFLLVFLIFASLIISFDV